MILRGGGGGISRPVSTKMAEQLRDKVRARKVLFAALARLRGPIC
jgi:hypothetical protein